MVEDVIHAHCQGLIDHVCAVEPKEKKTSESALSSELRTIPAHCECCLTYALCSGNHSNAVSKARGGFEEALPSSQLVRSSSAFWIGSPCWAFP